MRPLLALIALACLSGCAAESSRGTVHDAGAPGRPAVTYAGDIPCADCPGIRMTLTLFPDLTFRLRRVYLERDVEAYDLGRWARAQDDGTRLRLRGEGEGTQQFAVVGADRLRMLDIEGREIRSALHYDLTRAPAVDPVAGPMPLRGVYTSTSERALFEECLTGKRFPVNPDGARVALEASYLALQRQPGESMLVSIRGRFVSLSPAGEGESLTVEAFDRPWPGETCASAARAQAPLLETYWRATEIDGQPVPASGREPYIVLSARDARMHGSSGCNSVAGGFERSGDALRFTRTATTRMACPPPVDELEVRFLDALNATARQRIAGTTLELLDAAGKPRMRLKAATPPR